MNCIQPTAPAELGPMLRPKFDSILLIAASTCHGIPYAAPAPSQSARRSSYVISREGRNCDSKTAGGSSTEPGSFGVSELGSATGATGATGASDRRLGHDGERVGRGAAGAEHERERRNGENRAHQAGHQASAGRTTRSAGTSSSAAASSASTLASSAP